MISFILWETAKQDKNLYKNILISKFLKIYQKKFHKVRTALNEKKAQNHKSQNNKQEKTLVMLVNKENDLETNLSKVDCSIFENDSSIK